MKKIPIYQLVIDLIEPTLQGSEIKLVDVEYKKIGKNWTLRVLIDKNQGVTVFDCQKLSREIEDLIEIHELIKDHYILEVSSPGLDRPLKKESDFIRNKGKQIQVNTYSPINNSKVNTGTIRDFSNSTLFLENKKDTLEIPLITIMQAKLIIEF
ncbi:MAG: ribosome maturation factor RimP [Nitrospina sp.]|nr:ribosome maturation factor RimP [Nitrospina sp.]